MIQMSHEEAILFRVLTSFFGGEHVIPHMSVMAVCGGKLPEAITSDSQLSSAAAQMGAATEQMSSAAAQNTANSEKNSNGTFPNNTASNGQVKSRQAKSIFPKSIDANSWAKRNKCLFTIVDKLDQPCMVIEFFSGFAEGVDVVEVEHQRYLKPILKAAGVNYVTMTSHEFSEIVDPSSSLDFFSFLKSKVEPYKAMV